MNWYGPPRRAALPEFFNEPQSFFMEDERVPAALLDENGHPSPKYQAYAQYRQAHQRSVDAYNNAYEAALASPAQFQMWPIRGKVYQTAVDAALNDWLAAGHKAEVERAMQAPPP